MARTLLRWTALCSLIALVACATTRTLTTSEVTDACAALRADSAFPTSVEDAEARKAGGERWTSREIRRLYVCEAEQIGRSDAEWTAGGLGAEERSVKAYDTRHAARMTARAMMSDQGALRRLEERDRKKYGNPDGPTYEWLVEKGRADGLEGDALYESIVAGAQRTDPATNQLFGL